jgi:signal transduction histidine kinase
VKELSSYVFSPLTEGDVALYRGFGNGLSSIPLINLVMNGTEAMQPVTHRSRELVIRSHQDEKGQVVVSVTDCGVGISAENADRLFNALFTTKPSGTGMGLRICRSIVEAHGGRLSASVNAGSGATFQFVLPLHRQEHAS